MRWWIFLPAMALVLAVDVALFPAFRGWGHVPRIAPVLLAFVALYASRESAIGAAIVLGAYLDALLPALGAGMDAPSAVPVFGPHMLACAAGAWAVLESRSWLYRRNLLTVAFAAFACALFSSLAFIAIAGIRAAYADPSPLWGGGSGAAALGADVVDALLGTVLSLPAAWLLQASLPAWSFATAGPRFSSGHRVGRDP